MQNIKCPFHAWGECQHDAEVVSFGENTKSAKAGKAKKYLRCPLHGSMRFDKDISQITIEKLVNGNKPENPTVKPEIPKPLNDEKPETIPEKVSDKINEDWGF